MNALGTVRGHNYVVNAHELRQNVTGIKNKMDVGMIQLHPKSISLHLSDY